jgi:carbamoyl-phosphate synthase large subunit
VHVGSPHTVELIRSGAVQLILNTPLGPTSHSDGEAIRATAVLMNIPLLTTLTAASAAVNGIGALKKKELTYFALLQFIHIPYVLYAGLRGQTGTYEWKGRQVR